MALTDVILAAVAQELKLRRVEIDSANDTFRKVTLTVNLSRNTQMPRSVVFASERERNLDQVKGDVRATLSIKRT